jgi:hypothetical protein
MILIAMGLTGCATRSDTRWSPPQNSALGIPNVVARVNREPIYRNDWIRGALSRSGEEALRDLIDGRLIRSRAAELKIEITDADRMARTRHELSLLRQEYDTQAAFRDALAQDGYRSEQAWVNELFVRPEWELHLLLERIVEIARQTEPLVWCSIGVFPTETDAQGAAEALASGPVDGTIAVEELPYSLIQPVTDDLEARIDATAVGEATVSRLGENAWLVIRVNGKSPAKRETAPDTATLQQTILAGPPAPDIMLAWIRNARNTADIEIVDIPGFRKGPERSGDK